MGNVFDRVSLRAKLVAAVLGIVAASMTAISVSSVAAMQGYLLNRVDDDLRAFANTLIERRQVQVTTSANGVLLPSPYVFEIRAADGRLESAYPEPDGAWPKVPSEPAELKAREHRPFTVDSVSGMTRWRLLIETVDIAERKYFLVIGANLNSVDNTVDRLSHLSLLIGLVVLGAAALVAIGAVWASLRPLGEIERTATAIAAGDLSRRVPDRDPRTEVGRLARVLNMMFNQIETAFRARERSEEAARSSEERMRRFVADASHELRSPLTSIRGFAELHRHGGISDTREVASVMRRIEDEASRMGLLVEDLLLLARLDQQRPIDWRPVDVLDLAADTVVAARATAPDRRIELVVGGAPVVLGDEGRLRQVLDNLVRNALIHTPAGTPVEVRVRAEANDALLEVADEGPGLDPEQAERVFERFYRADSARSRRHGSTGLGLAIVAALAAAHGGRAGVANTPSTGAIFWVRLPLAPEGRPSAEADSSPHEVVPDDGAVTLSRADEATRDSDASAGADVREADRTSGDDDQAHHDDSARDGGSDGRREPPWGAGPAKPTVPS